MSDSKKIARNTVFLYIRMLLIMGVSLYTSRVTLDVLGVDDYGLNNVVSGVVGMLSFLSGTLSLGTSRFITFQLGTGDKEKQKETFSTAFYTHLGLGLIMAFILETIGLWCVYNKLVIPDDRISAAVIVYHISIFTMLVNVTQMPYTAAIMAHERMGIYAYLGIFEAATKLAIVFFLRISPIDKLVFFAILLAVLQVVLVVSYRLYCILNFEETHLRKIFNKDIFKDMMSFSGWNVIANLTEVLKLQGIIVLMNLFFAPAIVAAQAFANQIAQALMQFVTNFRTAINPQIIKLYASEQQEASRQLTLSSTIFAFDLVLMITVPPIFIMDKILDIWLVEVPPFAVIFAQYTLIQRIISVIDGSLYPAMLASGKIKSNAIGNVFLGLTQFVILYLILKNGGSVMWVQYMNLIIILSFSLILKPFILINELEFKINDLFNCLLRCFLTSLLSVLVSAFYIFYCDIDGIAKIVVYCIVAELGIVGSSYLMLKSSERNKLNSILVNYYKRIRYGR